MRNPAREPRRTESSGSACGTAANVRPRDPAAVPDEPSILHVRSLDLLRALLRTLARKDLVETAVYVALSLGAAFAGSVAALLLVPLVQPDHALPFGGALLGAHRSVGAQAAVFAAASGAFALLRGSAHGWSAAMA
jgi:ATP-binding cassette subfamily C protein